MQSFIISHSSCAEQYGDMTLNIVIKCNWVTGSPPNFDTLLAVWYRTYMQSFIISHSSCAEQYGDMSPDTHTHTHTHTITFIKFNWVTGSPPNFDNMATCPWTHMDTHTIKVLQLAVQQVGHTSIIFFKVKSKSTSCNTANLP